jgi:uncharacterized membrane protein
MLRWIFAALGFVIIGAAVGIYLFLGTGGRHARVPATAPAPVGAPTPDRPPQVTGDGGLKLCNNTDSKVGVALGYKDKNGWASEGWWNVDPHGCETLLTGELVARFYYIYAVDYDNGGSWGGTAIMCTRDKLFTIRGLEDCEGRGYQKTGFFEVDTGEESNWTVNLSARKGAEANVQ